MSQRGAYVLIKVLEYNNQYLLGRSRTDIIDQAWYIKSYGAHLSMKRLQSDYIRFAI